MKKIISLVLVSLMVLSLTACGGKTVERTGNEALGILQWKMDSAETAINNINKNTIIIHYVAEIKDEYKDKYKLKEIKYVDCDEYFIPSFDLNKNMLNFRLMEDIEIKRDGGQGYKVCSVNARYPYPDHEDVKLTLRLRSRDEYHYDGSLEEFKEFITEMRNDSRFKDNLEPTNYIKDIRIEVIEK